MPCRALPCSVPPDQTAAPRTRAVLRSLWAAGAFALLAAVAMVAAEACLPQAQAAESAAVSTEHSVATLITDSDTADGSTPLRVALRLKLQPGWHTYWQNPGDAGEATAVTITAEGGLTGKTDAIQWPTPQRIRDASLMSYAYTGDVVLPLSLPLHAAKEAASAEKTSATGAGSGTGAPTTLKAHASWLVCASVCVPEEADLSLPLATGAPHPSAQTPLFEAATQATPVPSPYTATLAADGTLRVSGQDLSPRAVKEAWFMPDKPGLIDQAAPQNEAVQNGAVELHLKRLPDLASTQSLSGILVLKDAAGSEHALYQTAKPAPGATAGVAARGGSATAASSLTQAEFGQQVVFAFLGGLILNLMPCVFPILAMKALSVAKLGKAERRTQITSAGCYALGVMVTFLALGGLMMALRVAGAAEGWGFQFQSPVFVTLITWLLFGMALNLLGVFEFMPVSGGVSGTPRHGHWHDVLTGILAVVVATPCTAPFMGVAIAGALSGPPVAGLAVFAAMGLGLAAPYLLLTAIPGLAARMPRPGPWMQYLRQFLAFPLLGSCVWLLWVAALEGGASVVLLLATGMVLLSFAAWLYGVAQTRLIQQGHTRTNAALHGLALLGLLGALALIPALLHQQGSAAASPQTSALPKGVEPFSTARFEALKAAGKPVFVDMTAAWCITCLVNERVALDVPATQQAFAKQGITVLRGDWTNHDPAISAFLKERGRDGVPLYIYSPAHGPEVTLPQILTPGLVISTLENQTK
ncbi:thioredoxin family protein [Acetobacter senegalensis]|uniref:protein-disulfide reductase DsbD family protein n=1 Tax=Acetobacter senegalensis TaxID=446692 RepID=UPI0038D13320|nr:thioredoxin family protein [Acetobacter senegalensis]